MKLSIPVNKPIFLFYGDVIKSHGTTTYLSSLIKYIGCAWTTMDSLFLQAFLPNSEDCLKAPGLPHLLKAPFTILYPYIPKIIWRLYELFYCYVKFCKRLLQKDSIGLKTFFISGETLLPLVFLCKLMGYQSVYVKMGIIEELLSSNNKLPYLKYLFLHALEINCLNKFDIIIVVSEGMRQYIHDKYRVSPNNIITLPCAVDQEICRYKPIPCMEIRKKLGLENRLVFVYCGIYAPWQCIQETIACFKLLKKLEKKAFFLILSPDVEIFNSYLTGIDHSDYRVLFVEHSLIDQYLSAADAGFLLRKYNIINQVASPLKFSEYLICGLPVIIGPKVGDFSELVMKEGIGVVLDPNNLNKWGNKLSPFLKKISHDRENIRMSCIQIAINKLSWQAISYRVKKLQDKISFR
ncbi:MAG: glycosyltransferase [bacterium]